MGRTFLDANVLLELILGRAKQVQIEQALRQPDQVFVVSFLSVHLCYHYCLQQGVSFGIVNDFLAMFEVLAMDGRTVRLAQERYAGRDFEDCLQAACAEAAGCERIVTLDRHFERVSGTRLPVQVL